MTNLDKKIRRKRQKLAYHRCKNVASRALVELAVLLNTQGQITDFHEAISLHRSALNHRPSGHPDRDSSIFHHQLYLWCKRVIVPALGVLTMLGRAALELRSSGHRHRAHALNNLENRLRNRFMKLGTNTFNSALYLRNRYDEEVTISELQELITLGRAALEHCPPNHPRRAIILGNLAGCLRNRFMKLGTNADLDEAISLRRSALGLRPARHPDRSTSLSNLRSCLRSRLEKQGVAADLDGYISPGQAMLVFYKPGHHNVTFLLDLASDHYRRFQKIGATTDLEGVITIGRTILELHPLGDPDRARHLNTVVLYIGEMLDKFDRVEGFDEAVALARQALKLHRRGDPTYETSLSTLASFISARFQKQGNVTDLEEAIGLRRDLLALCPTGHPRRPSSLHDLALCLSDRFDQLSIPADINEAIILESSALELCSPGHPDWAISRKCLALYRQKITTTPNSQADVEGVKKLVIDAVYDIIEFLPPRLMNTYTGVLCDRDALISAFENSEQCKQLLSSATTHSTTLHYDIRNTVSTYFKYVTLSHRWGRHEPLLRHIQDKLIYEMAPTAGVVKLQAFCATACNCGYLWAWSDTCCIDKDSTVELARAIASMFSWYRRSALTIVYLSDVSRWGKLSSSAWFTRGWTLQELLAPCKVLFYTQDWSLYTNCPSSNHKEDDIVLNELERVTGIASRYLTGFKPGLDNARSRLQWASGRRTTEPEDIAYSLFGIFNVFLPIIPGESAEKALGRLLTEIISQSGDISVLDWVGDASSFHSCFPARIASYQFPPCPPLTFQDSELQASVSATKESVTRLVNLFDSLLMLDPPHFIGNRLRLPCIVYDVIGVQLQEADLLARKYVYEIQVEGIMPFQVTLMSELTDTSPSLLRYVLIQPWQSSKSLVSSTESNRTTHDKLATMLRQPFSALLLEERSRNEYKRIPSSSVIVARPADATSILRSRVQTLNVV
ncbi:hypothetical protein V8B97DRAFT_1069995 [Scleroderma yunnanense]